MLGRRAALLPGGRRERSARGSSGTAFAHSRPAARGAPARSVQGRFPPPKARALRPRSARLRRSCHLAQGVERLPVLRFDDKASELEPLLECEQEYVWTRRRPSLARVLGAEEEDVVAEADDHVVAELRR